MNPTAKNQVVKSVSQPVADEAKVVKKVSRKFRAPGGSSRKLIITATASKKESGYMMVTVRYRSGEKLAYANRVKLATDAAIKMVADRAKQALDAGWIEDVKAPKAPKVEQLPVFTSVPKIEDIERIDKELAERAAAAADRKAKAEAKKAAEAKAAAEKKPRLAPKAAKPVAAK